MRLNDIIDLASGLATILTAIFAGAFWFQLQLERRQKRLRLERFLREHADPNDRAVPISDLVVALGMTESEITDAAFRSRHIERTRRGVMGKIVLAFAYDHPPPSQF